MRTSVIVSVAEIKREDQFRHDGVLKWTAIGDAKIIGGVVHLEVFHADGGRDVRLWDAPFPELAILRDTPNG